MKSGVIFRLLPIVLKPPKHQLFASSITEITIDNFYTENALTSFDSI